MTARDRLKLAKAARELASEYAEGRGPKLKPYDYCGCAIAQVFERASIANPEPGDVASEFEGYLDTIGADYVDLTQATFHEVGTDYSAHIPGAVVFPLLALADELESAR